MLFRSTGGYSTQRIKHTAKRRYSSTKDTAASYPNLQVHYCSRLGKDTLATQNDPISGGIMYKTDWVLSFLWYYIETQRPNVFPVYISRQLLTIQKIVGAYQHTIGGVCGDRNHLPSHSKRFALEFICERTCVYICY